VIRIASTLSTKTNIFVFMEAPLAVILSPLPAICQFPAAIGMAPDNTAIVHQTFRKQMKFQRVWRDSWRLEVH
jgi:hypothetical protein